MLTIPEKFFETAQKNAGRPALKFKYHGTYIGGWIFSFFGGQGITGFNLYSLIVALIGAVILIALYRAFAGTTRPRL